MCIHKNSYNIKLNRMYIWKVYTIHSFWFGFGFTRCHRSFSSTFNYPNIGLQQKVGGLGAKEEGDDCSSRDRLHLDSVGPFSLPFHLRHCSQALLDSHSPLQVLLRFQFEYCFHSASIIFNNGLLSVFMLLFCLIVFFCSILIARLF